MAIDKLRDSEGHMARNMDYWIINTAQVLFLPWAHFPMAMVYLVPPMQCAFKVCNRNLASRLPDMASSKGAMRSRATAGVWGFAMIERICTLAVDDTTVFRNYDKH